jgi:hypothetical protein
MDVTEITVVVNEAGKSQEWGLVYLYHLLSFFFS